MENQLSLLKAELEKVYKITGIDDNLEETIRSRLMELGFVRYSEVQVIGRSNFSKCAIVQIMGTRICMDNKLLDKIRVEKYE